MDSRIPSSFEEQRSELTKEEAIQQLMILYGNSILHLAFTYVKDRSTAEDIAQEAFLKCFEKYDQFQGQSSMKTWVYRIAVNLCKDYVQSWHFRKIGYDLVHALKEKHKTWRGSVVENEVMKQDEQKDLSEQVLNLPVQYREVILLHYYEELSIHEISSILKTKETTIRTRIRRARQMLKSTYTGKGEDNEGTI